MTKTGRMPERTNHSVLEKCNSCATSNGSGLGPLPTVSHAEVCCLFKVAAPGCQCSANSFLNEGCPKQYDGRCQGRPSRLKALQLCPVYRPGQRSRSDASQEGCEAALTVTKSPSKNRKKIEPRLRLGFKKLTLEIRPRQFKKKLWFGTYTPDEIDRAMDAVNYYTNYGQPYKYPDSPEIFAQKPLKGIKFEDLLPSCDQYIQVGDEPELTYLYFARQVKEVIHSVMGKRKKSAQRRPKCKVSHKLQSDLMLEEAPQVLDICDPIMCTSAPERAKPEIDHSQCAASHPIFLPHDEVYTEMLRCLSDNRRHGGELTLQEMFDYPSAISTPGSGVSSPTMDYNGYLVEYNGDLVQDNGYMVEDNGYLVQDNGYVMGPLWFYQNEDQGFLHEWNSSGMPDS